MASNETVAEILRMMRDARNLDPSAIEDRNHLLSDWYYDDECQGWLSSYADRIEAAHKHEVEELNFKLMTSKSEQKTAANVIIEQTNKVEKLEREIAELREFCAGKRRIMAKCDRCDGEALYQAHGELLCRDCLVEEYGLCAACANVETCLDRDDRIVADFCSQFEEVKP